MFAGIVEGAAVVQQVSDQPGGKKVQINLGQFAEGVEDGDSICVDGVCLTVAGLDGTTASFNLITETLKKTTLGRLQPGSHVNIERSLKVGDRIDGHYVQGHVDGVGQVTQRIATEAEFKLWIDAGKLMKYIVPRGSIAVNGVSLTIAETKDKTFTVALIPTTLKLTNLGQLEVGDSVNIETDILARQIVAWLDRRS